MTRPKSGRTDPKPLTLSAATGRVTALRHTAGLFGHDLYPWQARAGRVGTARHNNRWRYPVMVCSVPRQSGKTRLVLLVCVERCLSQPGAQVWYTAQSRNDAALRFREFVRLLAGSKLEQCPHRTRLDGAWDFRVRAGMGTEEIEFRNGSQFRIFAPAEDSLHGSVTDLVVLDEARFFDSLRGDALMAAALPTQATRDGQVWVVSTAGGPESMFLHRQLEIGRESIRSDGHVGVVEYGIGADVAAGDLLSTVWAAHPAAGLPGGPRWEALQVAAEQMPTWQFAHEYGNRWRTVADARLLPADLWAACQHEPPLPAGRPVFTCDIPLDRSESVIVACVDGVVEVVDSLPAAAVPSRLVELVAAWDALAVVVDAAGPAGTIAERLRLVCPDRLVVSSTRELTAACQMFYDSVIDGTARVRPSLIFNAAAQHAARRSVGQSWVWSRVDGGAPLVAASLAVWQWAKTAAVTVDEVPAIF
jgi:hypothetical protein